MYMNKESRRFTSRSGVDLKHPTLGSWAVENHENFLSKGATCLYLHVGKSIQNVIWTWIGRHRAGAREAME